MANYGDGQLAYTFPHFPGKVDFMFTKNRIGTRIQAQHLPWVVVKGTCMKRQEACSNESMANGG